MKNPLFLNGIGSTVDRLTALENVVNILTDEMYEKRVKQAQADIRETSEKVTNIDETQRISFETLANDGQIDEQVVLAHKDTISEWVEGTFYKFGQYVRYLEKLYKVIQEHTAQGNWTPDITPALYAVVNETHKGTIDDPIPITEDMRGQSIEYTKGLYYIEGGTLYLMSREGMNTGETITLAYFPSELVGIYFTVVEAV